MIEEDGDFNCRPSFSLFFFEMLYVETEGFDGLFEMLEFD